MRPADSRAGILFPALLATATLATLTGCGGPATSDAAAENARKSQQATLDRDWRTACALQTEAARERDVKGPDRSVDACAKDRAAQFGTQGPRDGRITLGTPVAVGATGSHPAGMGVRVTVEANGMTAHSAYRMVQDDADAWLVDQTVNLVEEDGLTENDVREELASR
ncbi:hypothetical protein OG897_04495 [Streptomyces sp. NBC_00237]|uniref:hypothetical protein n=1 Tax=Streptomyces sp. NBC_00237 TaxID=2975687 RepID=UPI0022592FC1|nr:hypothetical protein [Streptomyces sp. NBC_00237]MCX5200725.1 hypothetical protein [Streptomyces sp. NBC_00237]